jgi:hypothetical protein
MKAKQRAVLERELDAFQIGELGLGFTYRSDGDK